MKTYTDVWINSRKSLNRLLVLACSVSICAMSTWAAVAGVGGKKDFKCFSGNAYIGAEIEDALNVNPANLEEILTKVTGIYVQVLASEPPVRMSALAKEIAAAQPDVASLVEMYTLEKAPATLQGGQLIPGEFTVVFDFLNLLTNALAASGAQYNVAVVSSESDIEMPMLDLETGGFAYGRIVDHEVILYRGDLPQGYLRVSNPQTGQFANFIQVPQLGVAVNRGWCSVDVFTRGERFRYICSHLEVEAYAPLQMAQAQELLAGPANTTMPVLLTGDFNADPFGRTIPPTPTYGLFPDAGFKDAWTTTHPQEPTGGLTWGHDALLADPSVGFISRIDLILYRGAQFDPTSFEVMDLMLDESTPPLWPSDHATVAASFLLGNPRAHKAMAAGQERR